MIIAPRHIERAPEIGSLIERRGFGYQLRSDLEQGERKRSERIVIINTYGELFKVYSVGTIVFCGGSLVPLGGQNPLEPAAWAKVAFYGPSMEEFSDAAALLVQSGGGVQVSSPAVLAEKAAWFLGHPDELKRYGDRALDVALAKKGAAEKHALVIKRLLSGETPMSGHP